MATGWRVVPVQAKNGNPNPYKSAQTYRPESYKWQDGIAAQDILAVALDAAILLDYDGNKPGTIPESELAALVGTLPEPVQVRGGSKHWLFKLPAGFNPKEYKYSADGQLAQGVDVKRGNQLVYVKRGKTLPYGGTFPRREELPEAPQALIDILKITAPVRTTFADYAPSKDTKKYGANALYGACNAIAEAEEGKRNPTLFKQAAKVYELVAGGEISEADAELALYSAADAAGLDPAEIDATMASAKEAGFKQPRKAPPRIASPDEFQRYEPIPESPQVRANKAAAAPVTPAPAESVGQPGGEPVTQYIDPGFIALPDTGAKGRILNTSRNLRAVVRAHGVHLAYNVVSKRIDINVPGLKAHPDEHQNAALTIIEDFAVRAGMTGAKIPQQVLALAVRRPYNPFLSWVHSTPWDGVDRLDALAGTVQCTDHAMQELFKILLRRWLLSVVASQTKTGFWSKGCLVLQGKQSKGKTSWFRRLFADVPEVFADGVTLAIGDKDSLMNVLSHVAVELGELDGTFKKSDLAGLKAFISRKADRLRRPYAAGTSEWSRRTVFCATVNDAQFLSDDTGNSRFWAVSITALDYQHNINMQQLWAQVAAILDTGEQWHLTDEEAERLNESNKEFEIADPIEELIRVRFDPTRPGRNYSRTASQVVREIVGIANPTASQSKKAGVVLKAMGFKSRKANGAKVFDLPQPWESYEAPEIE
ncbi:TPA: VapE domain-containing protein [Klebsiella pneumoniae]